MPSPMPDKVEAAALRDWIESTVLADYGFHPVQIGETEILYSCQSGRGYLSALLDGLQVVRPKWAGKTQPTSEVLFRALSGYLTETPSHLVQLLDHDGAYWEVRRVERVTSDARYLPWVLGLIHREPADEAGATVILLLSDDRRSAVAITECPYSISPYPEGFCVAFHGAADRFSQLRGHLASAATFSQGTVR
jgi:hypothetical protein